MLKTNGIPDRPRLDVRAVLRARIASDTQGLEPTLLQQRQFMFVVDRGPWPAAGF